VFHGVTHGCRAAAQLSALLTAAGEPHSQRRHLLLLNGRDAPVVPDLWVPRANRFVFVHAQWPGPQECAAHAAVARLGHVVTVLIGAELRPLGAPGWLPGWSLDAFTGELQRGWTVLSQTAGQGICLVQTTDPADPRAASPAVAAAIAAASRQVDAADLRTVDLDLAGTLGKSLRLADSSGAEREGGSSGAEREGGNELGAERGAVGGPQVDSDADTEPDTM
jgi:hypothetical protein